MKKQVPILIILFATILITSFLNIRIRNLDTMSSIWVYLYLLKPSGILSMIGILFLLASLINKTEKNIYYFIIGLLLIWAVVLSFYPNYHSSQRTNLVNAQSLFIISNIAIVSLKTFEYFRVKTNRNNSIPES